MSAQRPVPSAHSMWLKNGSQLGLTLDSILTMVGPHLMADPAGSKSIHQDLLSSGVLCKNPHAGEMQLKAEVSFAADTARINVSPVTARHWHLHQNGSKPLGVSSWLVPFVILTSY